MCGRRKAAAAQLRTAVDRALALFALQPLTAALAGKR